MTMALFSMSMKVMSSGSSTLSRVLGKNSLVLSPSSSRCSTICSLSETRKAAGQSLTLDSVMGMKPALSSLQARLNSPAVWSNSSLEISAQRERWVSQQKQLRLKLSESSSLASTCPSRSSPALTAALSRQRQQMRSARTLTRSRPSRSTSSATLPEKLQVDSKNPPFLASSPICEEVRSVRRASCLQRKTGQTMLSRSFHSSQFTPTPTSRIYTCSTRESALNTTRRPLPAPEDDCRPGRKACRCRCRRWTGGAGAWLQRKSSSMQQCCWGRRENSARWGFSLKQFCSTATSEKVLELTSQNSSLSDTCMACMGTSLTSCSLAWPMLTSCLLMLELKVQATSRTTPRRCAQPSAPFTPLPSPSATHPRLKIVAATYLSRLTCTLPSPHATFSSCLKLTCLSPCGSCSPDFFSCAIALVLNSVAACAISAFSMMLLQRSPSPEPDRRSWGSAIIRATELKRSMLADLPLLPRRLSVSPTDCPRLPSPSSTSTDFRMRWNSAICARKRDSTFSWMGSTVTSRKGTLASTDSTRVLDWQSVSSPKVSRDECCMLAFQSEGPTTSKVPG